LVAWALRYNKAFIEACDRQDTGIAHDLLNKGADIDATRSGETALGIAASRGHLSMVKWLIGRGAIVDLRDSSRWTALHMVAHEAVSNTAELKSCMNIVEHLLDSGANINAIVSGDYAFFET
jgi:ankyrin repeat protein